MRMEECYSDEFVRGMEQSKTGCDVTVQFSGMECVFRMVECIHSSGCALKCVIRMLGL